MKAAKVLVKFGNQRSYIVAMLKKYTMLGSLRKKCTGQMNIPPAGKAVHVKVLQVNTGLKQTDKTCL